MSVKVVSIKAFGSPDELCVTTVEPPEPGAEQVLIAVEACGVGLVDVLFRKGLFPGLSPVGFVPGVEVAGRVVAGAGEWIGKRVFAKVESGGYAEQLIANVTSITEIPAALSSEAAVALGINALVAHFSLLHGHCGNEKEVLVRGAGGGIGTITAQLAKISGAKVTASTSSPEKRSMLSALGVLQFDDGAREYDLIIDPVAGNELSSFFTRLKANGRYVVNGVAGGFPLPDFAMPLVSSFRKSLAISFLSLNSITDSQLTTALTDIFMLAVEGRITSVIDSVYPLAEAARAHERLESGKVFGKVVLKV
ncbi:quinone oxidoreductase family protein [Chitinophaga arvensicola]|uniref:2-desacetyl-2-hydroxyethyl bacteriochlorophyllide A dehydrogenase n=1 Tax=Chitinophaga arvensicola TaxID=29529 RepID=A0A1I0RI02_9BACT|nr:zinc-binding dehydrogenase [Chitinophaga arvensicola]SEW40514.1 2-desacetyl-2-hydroxyethyl bacteriochlorophyllide A dehydrogenase [Chitinophaga arvensicola]